MARRPARDIIEDIIGGGKRRRKRTGTKIKKAALTSLLAPITGFFGEIVQNGTEFLKDCFLESVYYSTEYRPYLAIFLKSKHIKPIRVGNNKRLFTLNKERIPNPPYNIYFPAEDILGPPVRGMQYFLFKGELLMIDMFHLEQLVEGEESRGYYHDNDSEFVRMRFVRGRVDPNILTKEINKSFKDFEAPVERKMGEPRDENKVEVVEKNRFQVIKMLEAHDKRVEPRLIIKDRQYGFDDLGECAASWLLDIQTANRLNSARHKRLDEHNISESLSEGDRVKKLDDLVFPEYVDDAIKQAHWWKNNPRVFLDSNLPYNLGFMLYGPAGTGKTSLSVALAYELDIPIFCVDLSVLVRKDLINLVAFAGMVSPCMLLYEDLDAVFKGRENTQKDNSFREVINFSTFINILNGASRTDGLFTIITTNDIDSVDPALGGTFGVTGAERDEILSSTDGRRPGRINRMLPIPRGLNEEQRRKIATNIFKTFYPGLVEEAVKSGTDNDTGDIFEKKCIKVMQEHILNGSLKGDV